MSDTANPNRRTARVLMYTAYFDPEYSGAALQALALARELRQRGHHVEFVTNRWPGTGFRPQDHPLQTPPSAAAIGQHWENTGE